MNSRHLSFEFFPPRNEAQQRRFWHTLGCLQTLNPGYISMTWGALGSASQASLDILEHLVAEPGVTVTAHLSCAGQTEAQMRGMIEKLESLGISRFLALRGDQGKGGGPADTGILRHASELVALLAEAPHRDISVAAYPEAHPESASQDSDIHWLKHKLDAGARRAITQFFFEADTFLRFRDRARAAGIQQGLVPGILPVHDIQKVMDFSERCGASVAPALVERFSGASSAEARHEAAVEQCVELCQRLRREGVEDFHIYTLNQSTLTQAICTELLGSKVKRDAMGAAA